MWPLNACVSAKSLHVRAPQSRHAHPYNPLAFSSLLTMGCIPVLIWLVVVTLKRYICGRDNPEDH